MKKTKNKIALIITIALAVLAIGTAFYIKSTQDKADQGKTEQQILQEEEKKANLDPKKDNEAYYNQQNQTAGQQTGKASISLTSLSQDGNNVFVGTIVDGQTSGTCVLTISKPGNPSIVRTAEITLVTSYYTCKGFTLSKGDFSSKGEWSVQVKFHNPNAGASSETLKITVN